MPIYEYRCSMPQCGYEKSEILPMRLCDAKQQCPKCGAPMMQLMTTPGLLVIK